MAGSSRSLGALTLDLVLKLGGFQAGMDQAARYAEKRLKEIERLAYQFGEALGKGLRVAGAAAGVALTALTALTVAAINNADALNDVSNRTGVAVETLSGYAYAAKMTGTDLDTLSRGMKVLAKNSADALNPTSEQAKIFKALGISVVDTAGNLKSLDTLVPAIADKFKLLQDGTTKAALAQALFGKSGVDLTEFLDSGAAGLEDFAKQARDLGVIISSKTASAADEFNDQLGDLKTLVQGVGATIAAQLLPSLKDGAADFKELVKQGDLVSNTVTVLDALLKLGVGSINEYTNAVSRLSITMTFLADGQEGAFEALKNLATFGAADGGVVSGLKRMAGAADEGQQSLDALIASQKKASQVKLVFADTDAIPDSVFKKPTATATDPALGLRVQNALANPTVDKSVENQAKKVAKAIREMADAQRAWQTELDGTGNQVVDEYAKRLDEIAEKGDKFAQVGVPTEKVAAFRKEMEALALSLRNKELTEFQQNFDDQTLQIASTYDESLSPALLRYNTEVRELEKVLKSGAITQDEYNKRIDALGEQRNSQATGVLKDLQFEMELLGKTADEQERLSLARRLGADAATDQGKAAIQALDDYQKAAKDVSDQIQIMDGFRDSFADAFAGIIDGTKSVKDAFSDMLDDIGQMIARRIAENWVNQLFGQTGTNQGGSAGGNWFGAIASLFGGGRAAGGSVNPGMAYRVNENGPELLSVGSNDYLMMGKSSGRVRPAGAGAGFSQSNTFVVQGKIDRRTQTQLAAEAGRRANQAVSRGVS